MNISSEFTYKKKVALHTLGCRLNFSETGSIADGFADRGYEIVNFGEEADVTFINTCTVTDGADSTCRNLIRKAHRSSPEGKVVVAGCYAQMEADKIKKMEGVDLILGTQEKYKVFDYLKEEQDQVVAIDQRNEFWGAATTPSDTHTRAFLKIQDGCNYVCSFCIIPFARGRSRALPVSDAIAKAKEVVGNGFKEIILTGVNIGEYEANTGESLTDLVKRLNDIKGLERIRLGSVEPNTLYEELVKFMSESPKFMDHFHIPLQTPIDHLLKSMRRKYDSVFYKEKLAMVKSYFPSAGIGADIICGYPGESEEDFLETVEFLEEQPVTHFHVFPYSKRKNTTAAKLENQLQHHIKKHRVKVLNELGAKKLQAFGESLIGMETEVLWEQEKQGLWTGYTSQYVQVQRKSKQNLKNSIESLVLNSNHLGMHLQ